MQLVWLFYDHYWHNLTSAYFCTNEFYVYSVWNTQLQHGKKSH